QIIHGGLGYDDPIEVAIADPGSGAVHRLYPIFDEAAAGGLQLVINSDGEVVSRQISQDPYGGEESTLEGAAVDKITVTATKSSSGTLDAVVISVRLTEAIDSGTLPDGALIAGTPVTPTLPTPHTLRWTFTAAEWAALPSLTITITNQLRAAAWSATSPILPPPHWALASKPVFTSATAPFEYRESLASISTWLATIGSDETRTATLYEVENLASMGTSPTATPAQLIVASTFQALPFVDPATGLVYARNRWLDPRTGSFLSPDPAGYRDSSNLYTFTGGDPVNRRDPTGKITIVVHGTFAANESWWNDGSFAVGIDSEVGDIWKIKTAGNVDVSRVAQLRRFGPSGRFRWSGGNTRSDRIAGAQALADYINTIKGLFPSEPINVVAHSHGGNVATAATNAKLVNGPATIDQLVVIAKPHFRAGLTYGLRDEGLADRALLGKDPYEPDFQRIKNPILNAYSREDQVQTTLAEMTNKEGVRVRSTRLDVDPWNAKEYVNIRVPTFVGPLEAHGVQHSSTMGKAIGAYLGVGGQSRSDWVAAGNRTGLFNNWRQQTSHWVTPAQDGSNVGIYGPWDMGQ
ncbi:MAG TPA: RHS repeat-associated core domain-containing protein, partial [Rhodothermales bacterium]|nr:RHS repeat-associated core domain-containing protein [Rhodothermales bacterium]